MKFNSPEGKLDSAALSTEYEEAEKYGKLRVGSTGVFFPEGLGVKYIPFSFIDRAFIRIHEVNGKLCCGSTVFQYFRMVFMHDGKEYADFINEDEPAMDAALAAMAEGGVTTGIEDGN